MSTSVHATAVAIGGRAILLLGTAGAGKSELGLLLIERGAVLVSDDRVALSRQGDALYAEPPLHYAGVVMLRDIGPVALPFADGPTPLSLVVTLEPAGAAPALLPRLGQYGPVEGLFVPQLTMVAGTPAMASKVLLALDRWGH